MPDELDTLTAPFSVSTIAEAGTRLVPKSITDAGPAARFAWDEFFAGTLRNPHTRKAYSQKYEQGIDRLSVAFLVKLRDLYQVPLDYFVPATGPSARRVELDVQAARFAGDFLAIPNGKVRRQLAELIRSLATGRQR